RRAKVSSAITKRLDTSRTEAAFHSHPFFLPVFPHDCQFVGRRPLFRLIRWTTHTPNETRGMHGTNGTKHGKFTICTPFNPPQPPQRIGEEGLLPRQPTARRNPAI